ncbi:MAG: putative sphingomyelin phosphodiesterase [Candidatus Nomurabacteria bacterium]|jgi:endonuclease/exonuclease/phosphatase family metal-dependent hydrolase|nr:putative sphingomyelin phosphodiesterase [Candidatus Nomurabacteria bacterium]
MEIITYNIWDLPLWFVRNRKKRLLEIARYLVERGTDIICLQESWSLEYRRALSEYMRAHGYHDAIHQAGIKRGNGGLLTFSKFPIVSVRFIPFGRRAFAVSEIIGNKGALETNIETPRGLIKVINTHLHYSPSTIIETASVRLRQLRTLFAAIKNEGDMPTVLAGDFNEHDMVNEKQFERLFAKEGFVHHAPSEMTPTYRAENPLVNNWINRIVTSRQYDYILTRQIEKSGLNVRSYGPLYLTPVLSDHDPVSILLS